MAPLLPLKPSSPESKVTGPLAIGYAMPVLAVHGSLQAVMVWKALVLATASRLWHVSAWPGWTVRTPSRALASAGKEKDWIPIVRFCSGAPGNENGLPAPVGSPP